MKERIYKVYVHKVDTDNGPLYYTGVTRMQLHRRWYPSQYKGTTLEPYIIQYGWENIEHVVMFETGDRSKAYEVEDMLICGYRALEKSINKQRSGLIESSDVNAYMRNRRSNNPKLAEQHRQLNRNLRLTPGGRIYYRVHSFNHDHPDLAIETPLEAKRKYLESGYIPQYIKHDDL